MTTHTEFFTPEPLAPSTKPDMKWVLKHFRGMNLVLKASETLSRHPGFCKVSLNAVNGFNKSHCPFLPLQAFVGETHISTITFESPHETFKYI